MTVLLILQQVLQINLKTPFPCLVSQTYDLHRLLEVKLP
jgi:hypothetical protein